MLVVLGALIGTVVTGAALAADPNPPTTTASTSPGATTWGWNRGDVTVTLNATDETVNNVKSITYSATGAQPIGPTTVTAATASFIVTAEGTTTITYHATDKDDHVEGDKVLNVSIDRTPPSISIFEPVLNTVVAQGTFSPARWVCADAGPSGVATCEATEGSPATTLGTRALDVSTLGVRYLRIHVVDRAGNEATVERAYTVIPRKPLDDGGPRPTTGQIHAKGTIFLPSNKKCVRSLKIRIKIPAGKSVLGAVIFFDGKRKTSVVSRHMNKPVMIRHLPKKRFVAKVTLVTSQGGRIRMSKTYRTCGYGLKATRKHR